MAKTLPKSQRLYHRKAIQTLFRSGNRITQFPISLSYVLIPNSASPWPKVGVSVAKKRFGNAVDRNLLKRRMREAYRLNKDALMNYCEAQGLEVHLFFVYLEKSEVPYSDIEDKISTLINRLQRQLEDETTET